MSGPIEPHWDLLPDQPEAFFDLSGKYDLRDLKRKYNAFIRQFKPEKYPEEFQKIRAAFEYLNDALRYAEPPHLRSMNSELQFDWKFNDPIKQVLPEDKPKLIQNSEGLAAHHEGLELHEKVSKESLPEFYDDLLSKDSKTPYEYYALALCSDILPDTEHSFPYWLLEGLKDYPEDRALFELLRLFFAREPWHVEIADLLELTSQVIRSNRFYYLTERLWDEQIKNTSFETFRQNLISCESNLLDHEIHHMLVFYLHILKTAIWKADEDWINNTFSFIEENYERLPFWFQDELEFLYLLKEYREQRTQFLEGGPVRSTIDQTIFEYCTKNEQEADRLFLESQHKLVLREDELLHDFKIPSDEFESIELLWENIAETVYDRIKPIPFEEEEDAIGRNALQLGTWLLTGRFGFRYKLTDDISNFSISFVMLVALVVCYYCCIDIPNPILSVFCIIGLLSMSLVILKMMVKFQNYTAHKYYYSHWRFEILKFYQTKWFPLLELADELEEIESIKKGRRYYHGLDKIAELIRTDMGLFFYVTAQRLLTACQ